MASSARGLEGSKTSARGRAEPYLVFHDIDHCEYTSTADRATIPVGCPASCAEPSRIRNTESARVETTRQCMQTSPSPRCDD